MVTTYNDGSYPTSAAQKGYRKRRFVRTAFEKKKSVPAGWSFSISLERATSAHNDGRQAHRTRKAGDPARTADGPPWRRSFQLQKHASRSVSVSASRVSGAAEAAQMSLSLLVSPTSYYGSYEAAPRPVLASSQAVSCTVPQHRAHESNAVEHVASRLRVAVCPSSSHAIVRSLGASCACAFVRRRAMPLAQRRRPHAFLVPTACSCRGGWGG